MTDSRPVRRRAGRRSSRFAKALAWGWAAILVLGLLSPALPVLSFLPWHRGLVEQPSMLDKLIHGFLFLVQTCLFARPGALVAGRSVLGAVLVSSALGVATEALQAPIPTRSADWGDLVANFGGIALGVLWTLYAVRQRSMPQDIRRQDVGPGPQTR